MVETLKYGTYGGKRKGLKLFFRRHTSPFFLVVWLRCFYLTDGHNSSSLPLFEPANRLIQVFRPPASKNKEESVT